MGIFSRCLVLEAGVQPVFYIQEDSSISIFLGWSIRIEIQIVCFTPKVHHRMNVVLVDVPREPLDLTVDSIIDRF